MKSERLKSMLLPIGLLWVAGVPFVEHLMRIEMPDFAGGFLRGVGIGMIIWAVILLKFTKSSKFR
jgi:hypothetical protein